MYHVFIYILLLGITPQCRLKLAVEYQNYRIGASGRMSDSLILLDNGRLAQS